MFQVHLEKEVVLFCSDLWHAVELSSNCSSVLMQFWKELLVAIAKMLEFCVRLVSFYN